MKDTHLTLRLPLELAREIARRAKARGVPRSQLVREAVARHLDTPQPAETPVHMLTARDLAIRWGRLPRLTADEAADLGADIEAGRAALPPVGAPWD